MPPSTEEPPITEPLKLRVGGVYLDGRGERVVIVKDDSEDETYRFGSAAGHYYTSDGRWSVGAVNPYDLVSEVTEASSPSDDLRTRAALAALTGLLANAPGFGSLFQGEAATFAKFAVVADALIVALRKAPDGTQLDEALE